MSFVRRRFFGWVLISLPVLVLLVVLVVIVQAKAFLRSDRFRTFLGAKVSKSIRAEGNFRALDWTGTSFYTEGFTATGNPGGSMEAIDAEQLRAEVNLRGLWDRKWQVETVEVERLTLVPARKSKKPEKIAEADRDVTPNPDRTATPDRTVASGEKTPRPTTSKDVAPKNIAPKSPDFFSSLLPNQVDVRRVTVENFSLDGKNLRTPFFLTGLKVEAHPDGNAWMLQASGGTMNLPERPPVSVEELAVRYVDKTLFVSRGRLTIDGGGTATVTGQISERVETNSDLTVKLEQMPVATILPEDWRARLKGSLAADLHVKGDGQEWEISGPVTLTDGHLEALPVLDQVALFTRTQRFRQLNLEKVTADVVVKDGQVTISNLNAESPGLLRMTGGFVVEKGKMAGDFMVGVTPASLRWIPGSQTKVFTIEHDGYLWAPMRITGKLNHLREDLSERLAVAAGQDLIESLDKDPSKLKDTLKDAAKSLLDLFGN